MAYYILNCLEIFNQHKDRIILNYLGYYEHITKRKVEEMFGISDEDAVRLLHKMQRNNLIECSGKGRGAEYTLLN